MVEQTVVLQDAHPCIGAHEHIDPGGQCDDKDEEGAAFAGARNGIRCGIPQDQTDNGGQDRHAQRTQQYLNKDGVAEKARKICQCKLPLEKRCAFDGECIGNDEQHRDDDQDRDPHHIGIRHRTELFHMLTPSS